MVGDDAGRGRGNYRPTNGYNTDFLLFLAIPLSFAANLWGEIIPDETVVKRKSIYE